MDYATQGVCSRAIHFEVDDNNTLTNVKFIGGCSGNTQGVARLIEGMDIDEAIRRRNPVRPKAYFLSRSAGTCLKAVQVPAEIIPK